MKPTLLALLGFCIFIANARADGPPISARDLAARLSIAQEGSSYVRLIMQIKDPAGAVKISFQLQIKQRRTADSADIIYQVLWPKDREGEAVLLRQAEAGAAGGSIFIPSAGMRQLGAAQMSEPLFGSQLSYQDAIENFFTWPDQTLAGTEVVNRVDCVILESKPGAAGRSIYGSVKSWIDTRRLVPMRIEKYLPSGKFVRRIDTTRVAIDDNRRPIPANLSVRAVGDGSETDLDGSRIRHDVIFSDNDFSSGGMKVLAPPHFGPQ